MKKPVTPTILFMDFERARKESTLEKCTIFSFGVLFIFLKLLVLLFLQFDSEIN